MNFTALSTLNNNQHIWVVVEIIFILVTIVAVVALIYGFQSNKRIAAYEKMKNITILTTFTSTEKATFDFSTTKYHAQKTRLILATIVVLIGTLVGVCFLTPLAVGDTSSNRSVTASIVQQQAQSTYGIHLTTEQATTLTGSSLLSKNELLYDFNNANRKNVQTIGGTIDILTNKQGITPTQIILIRVDNKYQLVLKDNFYSKEMLSELPRKGKL